MSKKNHVSNSDRTISGDNNCIAFGSNFNFNIDLEIVSYFKSLSFEEKISVLEYMINIHKERNIK